jgi:hypothetical protein
LPFNTSDNIVHLASGIIALICARNEGSSIAYAKFFGFVYLLVAILGLFTHDFAGIIFLVEDNIFTSSLHFM